MPEIIYNLTRVELAAWCATAGVPVYRAHQLWTWLYDRRADRWSAMTNLPASLRDRLGAAFTLDAALPEDAPQAGDATRKLLLRLPDGDRIEAVMIPAPERRTVCVSSQVGCKFHCAFCASGQAGFRRQLETGEIVAQVLAAARLWGARPTHVVFMGIGEPFDNDDAVLKAARIINDPDGLNIGARRITLSTCGVIPGIVRLAGEGLQVELSVSLHAPDDERRGRIMPVNARYPLAELMRACRDYAARTRRLITFEYTLVRGFNDAPEQARALATLLRGWPARANLIPLSPVAEFEGLPTTPEAARQFAAILERAGVNVTLRLSKGAALQAACGQLRFGAAPAGATAQRPSTQVASER